MRENEYQTMVRARVQEAIDGGATSFLSILAETDGADPRLVRQILDENGYKDRIPAAPLPPQSLSWDASAFQEALPASDPALGQWWYTSDTLERLARHVFDLRGGRRPFRILCIGSPTMTPLLAGKGSDPADVDLTVVEADADILDMIHDRHPQVRAFAPEEFLARVSTDRFHLCLLDPPWYREEMQSFFACALAHLEIEGYILTSLPPLLTRPNILDERQEYLQIISEMGSSVVFLSRKFLHYVVPRFEEAAFRDVDGFSGKPWRVADLLVCRKSEERDLQAARAGISLTPPLTKQRFCRQAREFRVFLGPGNGQAPQQTTIVPAKLFSSNVSRRAHDNRYPDVWTSEKVGASVEDMDVARYVLSLWSEGLS
ncbi:MAG TPA: hypothetical protein VLV54_16015, partial [Thermoanaerobaculia bacterium]|nr:hypothetical protein [Thermoanaerobaculia bacterium]